MTLSLTILMLAMHPAVQERVYDEIKSLQRDNDQNVTYDELAALTYTEMVVKESLRLFPSVPIMGRQTNRTTQLPNFTLAPGITCLIPIFRLHRSQRIWGDNADQFDPERFSPERIAESDQYYFMPFSHGPRKCIGTWRAVPHDAIITAPSFDARTRAMNLSFSVHQVEAPCTLQIQ